MRPLVVSLLAAVAMSCTQPPRPSDGAPSAASSAATVATSPAATASPSGSVAPPLATLGDEGCTRPDATPVLDPKKVGKHEFHEGMGPRAEEKGVLTGNVPVTVVHTGCQHLVERYSFRLPRGKHAEDELQYWLGLGAEMLRELPVRADRAKATARWAEVLEARAHEKEPYVAGSEIPVSEGAAWVSVTVKKSATADQLDVVYDAAL